MAKKKPLYIRNLVKKLKPQVKRLQAEIETLKEEKVTSTKATYSPEFIRYTERRKSFMLYTFVIFVLVVILLSSVEVTTTVETTTTTTTWTTPAN
jgi:hypothetical protein